MIDYFLQAPRKTINKSDKDVKNDRNEKKSRKSNNENLSTMNTLNRVLYIGELPPDVDQYELFQLILSKGKFDIESLAVKKTRDNKSYAYVKFKSRLDAEKAKKALHLLNLRHFILRAENFDVYNKEHHQENQNFSSCNLFVKNLPENTTSEDFLNLLSPFGEIKSLKLKQDQKGGCLGYGYVLFEDELSAKSAIQKLNGLNFKGKALKVDNFHNIKQRYVDNNFSIIFIKRLPESIATEEKLENFFSSYGRIAFVHILNSDKLQNNDQNDKINSKEFTGVVVFEKKESAEQAVNALNNRAIDMSNVPLELTM